MKKILIIAPVLFLSSFAIAPSALAADCQQGYLQYSDGTYTNADGTACTPGANSGAPANASLFTNQSNPQSTGASGFTALAPIPGLTDVQTTSVVNSASLAIFFNNLYKYAIGLAGILAVIEIIWGGLEISTKDSVSKQSEGKTRITQAIFGLVLVLSPVLVFSIINPAILNLSVNLPPLETATNAPNRAATSGTLPVCNSYIRKNCTPPGTTTATQEVATTTPTKGLWCFERANPGAANDFVCASTQALCNKDYQLQLQEDFSPVSTCYLR